MNPAYNLPAIAIALLTTGASLSYAQNVDQPETDDVFDLEAYSVSPLEELASRAIYGETPVVFSTLSKDGLDNYLASQDLPLALNYSPSVFATNQGGGAGDARINVRGFNQRNVAVMVNGVPVNDMENGWVYWSNWDGVGDVASSIQLQRGMSNLNLAVPSIGGTLNVLTDPAALQRGGVFKQEFGSDGFKKTSLAYNSGLINEKFAVSGAIVRKQGSSYIDGVWTDAYAWYLGASYQLNEKNKIELYGLGAPQQHGQNLYQRNIGTYSETFARNLNDYDPAALTTYYERGFAYNETWNVVDESYTDKVSYTGSLHDRKFSNTINERENYYNKPQVSLNWYYDPDNNWKWDNVFYYSGGVGGGTGTWGSVARVSDAGGYMNRNRDWNKQIDINSSNIDANGEAASTGILRNSVNEQWTIGALSKVSFDNGENWKASAGLDWRTAEIMHRYEVRDLLGGDYYKGSGTFDTPKRVGEAFNYNNTNTVDWLGAFLQSQYDKDNINGFAMVGVSQIKYGFLDHFDVDSSGKKNSVKSDDITGYQIKGGGRYHFDEQFSAFANLGFVEKMPIFDAVIDDGSGQLYVNPKNEKFTSFEIGLNYRNEEGTLDLTANVYHTNWQDRSFSKYVSALDDYVNLAGADQVHQGIEFEGNYYFSKELRLDATVSLNDWTYSNDVEARYQPDDASLSAQTFNLYIKDLKVGEAPQKQATLGLTYMPQTGLSITGRMRHNRDYYANFDPLGRTNINDRAQSWKLPNSTVFDLHFNYDIPGDGKVQYKVFLSVLNAFDEKYIQDATDNDSFNAFDMDHDADDAAVHFGAPRTYNTGVKVTF